MAYDFPASPAENDEYVPSAGGQTYIYKAPRWLVKGIPPTGGGGGGGLAEAPVDGKQYGRTNAAWTEVLANPTWATLSGKPATFPPTVPIAWADVSGKPLTFPPTVPIAWTDVSGKPTTYPPTVPIAWTDVSGKPTTFPPTVPIPWTDVSGKPATYPPTLPINETDVTGLTTDLAAKVSKAGDTMTGQLVLKASDTTTAPLMIPQGVGPTSPADGNVWMNGTTLTIRGNGTSYATAYLNGTSTFTGIKTFTAKPIMKMSDSASAAINLPQGTAPASPVNGDMWATAAGFYMQLSGNTYTFASQTYVDTQDALKVTKAGDTMSGNLTIAPTVVAPTLTLNKANGGGTFSNTLLGRTASASRWSIDLGDVTAESGSQTGSHFAVARYTDAGASWDTPLAISRTTGVVAMANGATLQSGVAAIGEAPNDGTQYARKNLAWAAVSASGGAATSIADAPPATPAVGQMWWESDSGALYIWYADANSAQWVQVTTPPGATGDVDGPVSSTDNAIARFDGTSGKIIQDSGATLSDGAIPTLTAGRFVASSTFETNTLTAVLAPATGNGTVYLRPKGSADATGQVTVDFTGAITQFAGAFNHASQHQLNVGGSNRVNIYGSGICLQAMAGTGTSGHSILATAPTGASSHAIYGTGASGTGAAMYGYNGGIVGAVSHYVASEGTWAFWGNSGAKLSSGAWGTSDARIKVDMSEDDFTAAQAVAAIKNVPVITYRRIDELLRTKTGDGKVPSPLEHLGWRAQDIQPYVPWAVAEFKVDQGDMIMRAALRGLDSFPPEHSKEALEFGEEEMKLLHIQDQPMIATLWLAIQALIARIEELEKPSGV